MSRGLGDVYKRQQTDEYEIHTYLSSVHREDLENNDNSAIMSAPSPQILASKSIHRPLKGNRAF